MGSEYSECVHKVSCYQNRYRYQRVEFQRAKRACSPLKATSVCKHAPRGAMSAPLAVPPPLCQEHPKFLLKADTTCQFGIDWAQGT